MDCSFEEDLFLRSDWRSMDGRDFPCETRHFAAYEEAWMGGGRGCADPQGSWHSAAVTEEPRRLPSLRPPRYPDYLASPSYEPAAPAPFPPQRCAPPEETSYKTPPPLPYTPLPFTPAHAPTTIARPSPPSSTYSVDSDGGCSPEAPEEDSSPRRKSKSLASITKKPRGRPPKNDDNTDKDTLRRRLYARGYRNDQTQFTKGVQNFCVRMLQFCYDHNIDVHNAFPQDRALVQKLMNLKLT